MIQATQPDVVSVELCMDRIKILQLDEDTVLREAKDMNFQKVKANIAQVCTELYISHPKKQTNKNQKKKNQKKISNNADIKIFE